MITNRLVRRGEACQLDLSTRIDLESRVTDIVVKEERLPVIPQEWKFEDYAAQSPWKDYLFTFLGDFKGLTVLDIGCGYNPTPIYFALAGAKKVYACDVSMNALAFMQETARAVGVADKVSVILCAGEQISLASESIDIVHSEAALHHMQLSLAGKEIARILKKGGKGGFKDPLGENPLLEFARDYLPYNWKHEAKGTDRPLKFKDIETFGKRFSSCTYKGFSLCRMIVTLIWGRNKSRKSIPRKISESVDDFILRRFPFLQSLCRFVVTCVVK